MHVECPIGKKKVPVNRTDDFYGKFNSKFKYKWKGKKWMC
jgi:hypothetical protein